MVQSAIANDGADEMARTFRVSKSFTMGIARVAGQWIAEDDCLAVPAAFAAWLDRNVCHHCPHAVAVDVTVWGERGEGHGCDDETNHRVERLSIGLKAIDSVTANEITAGWQEWLDGAIRDAASVASGL